MSIGNKAKADRLLTTILRIAKLHGSGPIKVNDLYTPRYKMAMQSVIRQAKKIDESQL